MKTTINYDGRFGAGSFEMTLNAETTVAMLITKFHEVINEPEMNTISVGRPPNRRRINISYPYDILINEEKIKLDYDQKAMELFPTKNERLTIILTNEIMFD